MALPTCKVTNTNTGKMILGDILNRSDKSLRVALQGTTLVLNMSRTDVRRPYVGHQHGMEFTSNG